MTDPIGSLFFLFFEQFAVYGVGCSFGEVEFFNGKPRSHSVVCSSAFGTVYYTSVEKLKRICRAFPEIEEILRERASRKAEWHDDFQNACQKARVKEVRPASQANSRIRNPVITRKDLKAVQIKAERDTEKTKILERNMKLPEKDPNKIMVSQKTFRNGSSESPEKNQTQSLTQSHKRINSFIQGRTFSSFAHDSTPKENVLASFVSTDLKNVKSIRTHLAATMIRMHTPHMKSKSFTNLLLRTYPILQDAQTQIHPEKTNKSQNENEYIRTEGDDSNKGKVFSKTDALFHQKNDGFRPKSHKVLKMKRNASFGNILSSNRPSTTQKPFSFKNPLSQEAIAERTRSQTWGMHSARGNMSKGQGTRVQTVVSQKPQTKEGRSPMKIHQIPSMTKDKLFSFQNGNERISLRSLVATAKNSNKPLMSSIFSTKQSK